MPCLTLIFRSFSWYHLNLLFCASITSKCLLLNFARITVFPVFFFTTRFSRIFFSFWKISVITDFSSTHAKPNWYFFSVEPKFYTSKCYKILFFTNIFFSLVNHISPYWILYILFFSQWRFFFIQNKSLVCFLVFACFYSYFFITRELIPFSSFFYYY